MPDRTRIAGSLLLALAVFMPRPLFAAWSANGNVVCNATADQSNTLLASDGSGGMLVVWQDDRTGTSDLYALRLMGNGSIAPGWPANGFAVCTAAGDQKLAVIAGDGSGGFYLAWEDYRVPGGESDVYLQRVTASASIAAGWPANGLAVCALARSQGYPTLIADANGAVVAWQDERDGLSSDVYVQRVSGGGAPQWGDNGLAVCTAAGHQFYPAMISDGTGGAFLAWQDARNGDPDIYAQRVNSAGAGMWSPNGNAVCTAGYEQLAPRLVFDGSGGVILAWDDYRDLNADVFAQRLNASGVRQWAASGVALCTDLSEQYGAAAIGDGSGGAIVTWADYRGGAGDLYAQRISGAGAVQWAVNGAVMCDAPGDQFDATAVPDLANGMYLAWADARAGAGSSDLYVTRVTSSGGTRQGWQANGTLACNAANGQLRPAVLADGAGCFVAWSDERGAVGDPDIYAWRADGSSSVDVALLPLDPASLELGAPFPNPTRDGVTLSFQLPESGPARLMVVDVTGRRVRSLLDDPALGPGFHTIRWDGRDEAGSPAPAGLYLVALHTSSGPLVRKLTVVR